MTSCSRRQDRRACESAPFQFEVLQFQCEQYLARFNICGIGFRQMHPQDAVDERQVQHAPT